MLLQQRYIPIKIYLTHISHIPELLFLEFFRGLTVRGYATLCIALVII